MAKVLINDSTMTAIADSIRNKTGNTDKILADDMPSEIDGIQSGGSSYSENDDVCFWDYDGTLLYSCTLEEVKNMTSLPEVPDHSTDDIPLTFRGWNWTLEEVNALTRKADVGALYSPTDSKTHFTIRLTPTSGLTVTIGWFSRSATSTLTFDWGDGTVEDFKKGGTGETTISHTYADYGTYNCSIDPNGEIWNPGNNKGFIRESTGASIVIGELILDEYIDWSWPGAQGEQCFRNANIETCVLPYNMSFPSGSYVLNVCRYLKHINIPPKVTAFSENFIGSCYRMRKFSLPPNFEYVADNGFSGLRSMEDIRVPKGFKGENETGYAGRFMFADCSALKNAPVLERSRILRMEYSGCYSLKELIIPATVVTIDPLAFQYCGAMDYYLYSKEPPTLSTTDAFVNTNPGMIIHVPAESLEAYQTATNWVTYANYMRGDL